MSTELAAIPFRTFDYDKKPLRTYTKEDGSSWWVGNEACREVGVNNPRQALSRLDDDEKDDVILNDAIGRPQKTTIISEPGLYSLILSSRKPEAKKFKKWVTSVVLPQIRKTGSYSPATTQLAIESAKVDRLSLELRKSNQDLMVYKKIHDRLFFPKKSTSHDYVSLRKFCDLYEIKSALGLRMKGGGLRSAAHHLVKYSATMGAEVRKAPHKRFGQVNAYRADILHQWFIITEAAAKVSSKDFTPLFQGRLFS